MNKQEVYKYLDEKNIHYEVTEHEAVYNMAELSKIDFLSGTGCQKSICTR